MPVSNQREEIDERILRLLGLDDVFDLDYETYMTLLKEAMVKSRMVNKTIPTEEIMLLDEEYKKVKSKRDQGRFEVKKKKISVSSFSVGNIKETITAVGPTRGLLPAAETITKSPIQKGLDDNIATITSAVVSISETLKQQKKINDDASAYDKRKAEQEKRGLAESKLEKRFEGLKKAAEKIIAPVKSLLDRILEFFTTVILGRIVYKLVEWLSDPNNAGKVKSIIRFVKDWWPALLGSYILFGTSFGRLVRGLTGIVGKFIFKIGKFAIPRLLSLISKNPLTSLIVGTSVAGTLARTGERQKLEPELQKQRASVEKTEKDPSAPWYQKLGASFAKQELTTGQQRQSIIAPVPGAMFSGGGLASGFVSGEKGVDKVPAMLSDGEFVMSRGAVAKYGVDTLEAMNAAGGGTNKPKIVSGTAYAAGGGMIGRSNTPFSKDPIDAISRFIKFKFGADPSKQSTWGVPSISSSTPSAPKISFSKTSSSSGSTGSLITDPVGAVTRIANNMGIRTPDMPSGGPKMPGLPGGFKLPSLPSGGGKSDEKNFFQEIQEKLTGSGAATYRNAGNIYAKQMLGGFGGPISERDLAPESQKELQKAIQRAKKRTGSEISKAEAKIKELEASGASKTPKGKEALATQRSFLNKLKAGGIRVQYTDYADEKGKMSASAENAKNIIGQFWAKERSKKEGGGYRIEDTYDFDPFKKKVKDPKTGKMIERDLDKGELIRDVMFGKGKSTQQILQAAFLLNPFKGKGDVDMVLGGKRTAAENAGLAGSKTLLGGLLGASGKPKDKNTQALEAKRPWWDKMGMFGGASAQMKNEQKKNQEFSKKNPSAKLYNKPQKNTGESYKSRFARPKNAGVKPVKPPSKPPIKVIKTSPQGGSRSGRSKSSSSKAPNFSASAKGSATKQATLGLVR